jgi:hypothetical protein
VPKNLCNSIAHRSFFVQYHIQVSTINPVVLCKRGLTSLALDCNAQQTNNVIIAKYELKTAPTVGEGDFV